MRAAEARAQAGQFLAYAVVGTVATLVHYSLLIALVQAAGMDPLFSSTAGFVVGGVTAYFLNYRYTFASKKRHMEAASRFVAVALMGMALNTAIMSVGVYLLAVHYLLSQVSATGLVLIWTFGANRYWTFR